MEDLRISELNWPGLILLLADLSNAGQGLKRLQVGAQLFLWLQRKIHVGFIERPKDIETRNEKIYMKGETGTQTDPEIIVG